ncbi:MAK10-like protein [Tanacetum coccineum]
MEEYIRLEEEKARNHGKVFNWETAKYGKIWYDEDFHDLRSVKTEFPAIAFNDQISSEKTHSCEHTKIISTNDLKTDSKNDYEKVNMPSLPPPEPTISYFDDLDFFKDVENKFPAIVYNDAPTSKSDLLTGPILSPQHIDEIDLNKETSLSEYNEEEQNVFLINLKLLKHIKVFGAAAEDFLADTLADLGSCVNIIPLYLFKKLNIRLLEETDHVFGLADGTKSYPVGIVRDVEVHIGKLKLLNDFYVLDMKKNPETPLLVGKGFLAIANAVIDCRMAKIAVGEGITRSVFGVKGVDLGEEEAPYWTTLGKRESYKPQPSSDGIGAKPPYYARKDFLDCHLPGEWEISRDVELNPLRIP